MNPETHSAVVLLSGGLDSAACAAFYLGRNLVVRALFIDYGQPASRVESTAATRVADHLGLQLDRMEVTGLDIPPMGLIPARNALLVTLALSTFPFKAGLIALGVHAGTTYADCAPPFIEVVQGLADVYFGGVVEIAAPFLNWTKLDVYGFAQQAGVPMGLTYSCEAGTVPPCRACRSCHDVEAIDGEG